MPHAEHTVTIDRPIAQVFEYVADGSNNPRWRAGVLEINRTSSANELGAEYRQVLAGPGGRRIAGDYRISEWDPPRRLEFAVTAGPARPIGRFDLTEVAPDRTQVTFTLDLQPKGVMRLMANMIAKQMRTEVTQLDRMKTDLEQ
jgi:uncharacterized protein YndB with AHSA1/START domain